MKKTVFKRSGVRVVIALLLAFAFLFVLAGCGDDDDDDDYTRRRKKSETTSRYSQEDTTRYGSDLSDDDDYDDDYDDDDYDEDGEDISYTEPEPTTARIPSTLPFPDLQMFLGGMSPGESGVAGSDKSEVYISFDLPADSLHVLEEYLDLLRQSRYNISLKENTFSWQGQTFHSWYLYYNGSGSPRYAGVTADAAYKASNLCGQIYFNEYGTRCGFSLHYSADFNLYDSGARATGYAGGSSSATPQPTQPATTNPGGSVHMCSTCHGTGRVERNCTYCGGTGSGGKCFTCGGSGSVNCTSCGGDGTTYNLTTNSYSRCFACNGSGRKTCSSCNGRPKTCNFCSGTGKKSEYCSTCHGSGWVG